MAERMNTKDHVLLFVYNVGGIEKVRKTLKALKGLKNHSKFLAGISESGKEEGAKTLIASAMLGLLLAQLIYEDNVEKKARKN